jgi:hypothetical protein
MDCGRVLSVCMRVPGFFPAGNRDLPPKLPLEFPASSPFSSPFSATIWPCTAHLGCPAGPSLRACLAPRPCRADRASPGGPWGRADPADLSACWHPAAPTRRAGAASPSFPTRRAPQPPAAGSNGVMGGGNSRRRAAIADSHPQHG